MSVIKKKIVALGDYIEKTDTIEVIELPTCLVEVRLKRPSQEDSMKLMEFLSQNIDTEEIKRYADGKIDNEPMEKKMELLRFSYFQDAMLISSCIFYPVMDEEKKVWEKAEDVLNECDPALFDALKELIGSNKLVMTEIEAKK